jgi:hypothetical protein
MSFTRISHDVARITHNTQASRNVADYFLHAPGQGTDLPFFVDPQIRNQRWGANLHTDSTNLESDLRGLTRPLTKNDQFEYTKYANTASQPMSFGESKVITEESRATHPAWIYMDQDHTRWETPFFNPQANLEKGFNDNIQTRMLEKDYYRRRN